MRKVSIGHASCCIRPVLHPSCAASILCCIRPVLHMSCPASYSTSVLSYICCVLHPSWPASALSCPASVRHPSCPASDLTCIRAVLQPFTSIHPFLNPSGPLKAQSNEIFDLHFFSSFELVWVTDQWVKIFSILVEISLRYSNFSVEKSDLPGYHTPPGD